MNRTPFHRVTPYRLAILIAATAVGTGDLAHADVISSEWAGETTYVWEVNHMPDLDQRREEAFGYVGLPGDGGAYCVPTSVMNLFCYAANHGFEFIEPGPGWWQSQSRYNDAGNAIATLGAFMGTDPDDGTTGGGATAGAHIWLLASGNILTVDYYGANNHFCPTIDTLAWAGINGGIVAFAYGRYNVDKVVGDTVFVGTRTGGHMVTLARVARSGNAMQIVSRDPADDPDSDEFDYKFTQSPFGDRSYIVQNVFAVRSDFSWARPMTTLNWNPDDHDGKIRMIDGVLVIKPKFGMTFFNTGGPETHFELLFPNGWFADPPATQFQWAQDQALIDAVLAPDDDSFLVLSEGAPGLPNLLQRFEMDTEAVTEILPIPNASEIVLSRKRQGYILAGDRLHCVDLDAEDPVPITVEIPFPINALAFDDRADRVIGLSTLERALLIHDETLEGEPVVEPLPGEVQLSGEGAIAVSHVDGRMWMVSEENNLVYGVMSMGADGEPALVIVNNNQIQNPTDVSVSDDNHVLVTTSDGIVELEKISDTAWRPVENSAFAALEVGAKFQIARTRTNFDPETHPMTEWYHIHPDELIELGTYIADCPADMNDDGVVDVFDLLYQLGVWGADDPVADIAPPGLGDDTVDVFDLLELLSAWGDCP